MLNIHDKFFLIILILLVKYEIGSKAYRYEN